MDEIKAVCQQFLNGAITETEMLEKILVIVELGGLHVEFAHALVSR